MVTTAEKVKEFAINNVTNTDIKTDEHSNLKQLMLPMSEGTFHFLLTAVQLNKRHLSCLMSCYTGYKVVNITCYANECIN